MCFPLFSHCCFHLSVFKRFRMQAHVTFGSFNAPLGLILSVTLARNKQTSQKNPKYIHIKGGSNVLFLSNLSIVPSSLSSTVRSPRFLNLSFHSLRVHPYYCPFLFFLNGSFFLMFTVRCSQTPHTTLLRCLLLTFFICYAFAAKFASTADITPLLPTAKL